MAEQLNQGYHTLPDPMMARVSGERSVEIDWDQVAGCLQLGDGAANLGAARVIAAAYAQGRADARASVPSRVPMDLEQHPVIANLPLLSVA